MARKKSGDQVYVASTSGTAEIKGVVYQFHKGDRIAEGHPLVRLAGSENFLEPADTHVRFNVEQATAAPDETRDVAVPEEHHLAGDAVGDFESMTVTELREYAKNHGITPGTMAKQELIDAIVEAGE
jgi:hypothetical protein